MVSQATKQERSRRTYWNALAFAPCRVAAKRDTAPRFFHSWKIPAFAPRSIAILLAVALFLPLVSAQAGTDVMEGPARAVHEDPALVDPAARSVTLDHGYKTRDVYVLFHGLSNCPTQFRKLADLIYKSGANVVIPRMPYHGYRDRMTDAQAHLTARSMIANAQASIDHAHHLGDHVTVVGLSAGGVTAAWVAQNRPDVDRAFLIAPFFAIGFLPDWLTVPSRTIFAALPNSFIFWDPRQGQNLKGSPYAYPRFSTRAMAQLIRLGVTVFVQARRTAPAVRHIEIITNPTDLAVNNARTATLVRIWKRHGARVITDPNPEPPGPFTGSTVRLYEFPAPWHLPHDLIDPWHPDQQTDKVYPILLKQFGIRK